MTFASNVSAPEKPHQRATRGNKNAEQTDAAAGQRESDSEAHEEDAPLDPFERQDYAARWRSWEASRKEVTGVDLPFLSTDIFKKASRQVHQLKGGNRPCTPVEADHITAMVTAIGSTEALIQLQSVLMTVRGANDIPASKSTAAIAAIVTLLDTEAGDEAHGTIRRRTRVAKYAHSIKYKLDNELRPLGSKKSHITLIYEQIMAQAYPSLQSADLDDQRKKTWLIKRYRQGTRWLEITDQLSWEALLFIPSAGVFEL